MISRRLIGRQDDNDGNKSVLGLCGGGFSQHLGLLLEQLEQQYLNCF
jgi:hypothetical protein